MIAGADIISQPYAGEYEERIYDNESPWNSQVWSFVRFWETDGKEWVGQFRGEPLGVSVSVPLKTCMVLTSDYLFELDIENGDLISIDDRPGYRSISVAPDGWYVVADYYHFYKLNSASNRTALNGPIEMDSIEFESWNGERLRFKCDEFTNWERHLVMDLDTSNWKFEIISSSK
jgi:hypothetical protein